MCGRVCRFIGQGIIYNLIVCFCAYSLYSLSDQFKWLFFISSFALYGLLIAGGFSILELLIYGDEGG
jgi:hypothetical protein